MPYGVATSIRQLSDSGLLACHLVSASDVFSECPWNKRFSRWLLRSLVWDAFVRHLYCLLSYVCCRGKYSNCQGKRPLAQWHSLNLQAHWSQHRHAHMPLAASSWRCMAPPAKSVHGGSESLSLLCCVLLILPLLRLASLLSSSADLMAGYIATGSAHSCGLPLLHQISDPLPSL